MSGPGAPQVPTSVRVELAHAAVCRLARFADIDALVLKGPAMDVTVAPPGRPSSDVDLLVRPSQLPRWVHLLTQHGWRAMDRFETSSSFEHSQTFHHDVWGPVDVHRFVPGVGVEPEHAFDVLWERRQVATLAAHPCPVLDPAAQALVLCLHAARSFGDAKAARDLDHAWHQATPERQQEIQAWVDALQAHVAWAAVVGNLDDYRDHPAYRLWLVASRGGTRAQEWRARVAVAPTLRAKVRVTARAFVVNTDHLAILLRRRPTRIEVVRAFFGRGWRLLADIGIRDGRSGR